MKGCLESARASVLVNDCPTDEFQLEKGVRQGDRLSPYLFILAMEGLNIALKEATTKGIFQGNSIPRSNIQLSHLFYADDALFIREWSHQNIINLARLLKCFYVSSGLSVNFRKSKVFGIGVNSQEVKIGHYR